MKPVLYRLLACSALLLSGAQWGCHSPPPAPPPPPHSPHWVCPPPLVWSRDQERPVRLSLTNNTGSHVSVYLDQCDGHTRLGEVRPGVTRRLRLPTRLIPFNHQLRLHLFDVDTFNPVGIYAVDVEDRWDLDLAVDAGTPSVRLAYGEERLPARRIHGGSGFLTYPGEELSYASRWAEDTQAALTWQCSAGDAQITLTQGISGGERQPVSLEFRDQGELEWSDWTVLDPRSGSLLAPATEVARITERALEAGAVVAVVGREVDGQEHHFDLRGLADALTHLPCFSGRAPGHS